MNFFLVHPTGNQNVRAILSSLEKAGMLAEFGTTISLDLTQRWVKLIPSGIRHELIRRSFQISNDKVWTRSWPEIFRQISTKLGLDFIVFHERGIASIDAVYRDFDKKAANRLLHFFHKKEINAVYAYEDGALETFRQAKELGLKCVYDLPIAYWETTNKLMKEEAIRLPKWKTTLGGGLLDSNSKLSRKIKELELADIVIVPSQFVKDSLPNWTKDKKVIISHFGSPTPQHLYIEGKPFPKKSKNLRVLFVGSMGQRKGLGDLFEAIQLLENKNIELIAMGSLLNSIDFYKSELNNFTYEHERPHAKVLDLMRSCDVFCLPSIAEGRALVMQEAMSQGLPLVITPNTGGEDLIIEGKTGFLVPIRSPQKIAEKLLWFLNNRDQIPAMSKYAQNHAAKYTWENYGAKIITGLQASF